jgi:hypothetical protein
MGKIEENSGMNATPLVKGRGLFSAFIIMEMKIRTFK